MRSSLFKLYKLFRLMLQLPLAALGVPHHNCRFTPSCSEYMEQAIDKYGYIKGIKLGCVRISKCRPGLPGGFDPIP
jgi:putative membrane protein insertion efficiency factor